ncbi:predicted protein [Uncinocarpus reesii 1704]|uniref:AGC-kinase C-terminal domain-containing protein n=1 Tax=Uncinocarpus reesii (strain UAMH 1704) TaxID=336963 RepID=C4JS76_UNCRE|nr:uncharacterized protein UREG_05315 [Uncinocarpus reesii 1704]EEP80473.1 predicted protein [Uncinocarpus reesii 1704]
MPPSTVFSYLRRDHRRPSPSSTTAASPSTHTFPQLPPTASTTKLTDSIFETGPWTETTREIPSDSALEPATGLELEQVNSTPSLRPASNPSRPHSSSGESLEPLSSLTNIQKPHHHDGGLHKGISSWKRSFGGQKVGAAPVPSTGGAGKGKTSDVGGGISNLPFREHKPENSTSRRDGGYDVVHESSSSRGGKMRFHLLNPMALLARRRSAQLNTRAEDINIGKLTLPALPDDYDPRIRGKLFHDFSNPRPRPHPISSNTQPYPRDHGRPSLRTEEGYYSDSSAQASRRSRRFEHKPVFKEDFEDGNAKPASSQDSPPQTKGTSYSLPVFARNLPSTLPSQRDEKPLPEVPSAPPKTSHEAEAEAPHPLRSRPPTVREPPSQAPTGLPKHLTSSASRFSFDMAGGDSASQERLLEEKHKEKEAARKAKERSEVAADGFESDEFDYDAMMDDDGLEEKIPGVNADAEDYEDGDLDINAVQPLNLPGTSSFLLSPISSEGAPSPQLSQLQEPYPSCGAGMLSTNTERTSALMTPSLTIDTNQPFLAQQAPQVTNKSVASHTMYDEDELYYDDGLFGDLPEDMETGGFDESVFDDEASHLYERKNKANNVLPAILENQPDVRDTAIDSRRCEPPPGDANKITDQPAGLEFEESTSEEPEEPIRGLTQGNLQAYHDALAQAANEAALKGRFERSFSGSEASDDRDATEDSHPDLTAGESRHTSQNIEMAPDDVFDDFAFYDADDLDDDPMIAAANAEALENDDEGLYGQEFGFYAHSHPHCDGERVLGGYFGTLGLEGVKRNHSARANFQEPSLTPITERSEWSTRNSIVSLAPHGGPQSNPSISSPPLSQLLDMGHFDDEISLTALMKLRRGAFGGSNGSLRSNATSQTGQSPQSPSAPIGSSFGSFSSIHKALPDQKRANGLHSPGGLGSPPWADAGTSYQKDSESGSSGGLGDVPLRLRSAERPRSMNMEPYAKSRSPEMIRRHIRSNSATESISYVKETDDSGANCWVLERRRTGDDGEGEVVEREVMSSGHI